jgi:hypothetical protein
MKPPNGSMSKEAESAAVKAPHRDQGVARAVRIVVLFCDCFYEQSSQMASLGWWGMDMTTTAGGL